MSDERRMSQQPSYFFQEKPKNPKQNMTVRCTDRLKPEGGEGLVGSPSKSKGQTIHIAQAGAGQTGLEQLVKPVWTLTPL